jgi:hypothetical protein
VRHGGYTTRTDQQLVRLLASLRRLRFTAPELADLLDMPVSTISGVLKRIRMGKLGRLGLEAAARYERARPGELIHIDVKKLSTTRPVWPTSRSSPTRRPPLPSRSPRRAVAFYERYGITVERVITDG